MFGYPARREPDVHQLGVTPALIVPLSASERQSGADLFNLSSCGLRDGSGSSVSL
jgi:hypothetical protein